LWAVAQVVERVVLVERMLVAVVVVVAHRCRVSRLLLAKP